MAEKLRVNELAVVGASVVAVVDELAPAEVVVVVVELELLLEQPAAIRLRARAAAIG
jgi:hypothetical protein